MSTTAGKSTLLQAVACEVAVRMRDKIVEAEEASGSEGRASSGDSGGGAEAAASGGKPAAGAGGSSGISGGLPGAGGGGSGGKGGGGGGPVLPHQLLCSELPHVVSSRLKIGLAEAGDMLAQVSVGEVCFLC